MQHKVILNWTVGWSTLEAKLLSVPDMISRQAQCAHPATAVTDGRVTRLANQSFVGSPNLQQQPFINNM